MGKDRKPFPQWPVAAKWDTLMRLIQQFCLSLLVLLSTETHAWAKIDVSETSRLAGGETDTPRARPRGEGAARRPFC